MIITYISTLDGGAVVSKQILCPFCGLLPIPRNWGADEAYRWLEFTHLKDHVTEMADYRELLPKCARCQRYATESMTPTDPLHRACFSAECGCECSYPAPKTDLTPLFKEAE